MSVYLKKKKPIAGPEERVEVCGKPGYRPVFVWLGFCSRVCFSHPPHPGNLVHPPNQ